MEPRIKKPPFQYLFEGQWQHLLMLILMTAGAISLANPALGDGSWAGLTDRQWFNWGLGIVIAHQVIVWFVFRFQLVYQLFTRLLGKLSLLLWGAVFMPFLFARPLLLVAIGLADPNSLPGLRWLQIILGVALLLPAIYAMWSVLAYFGIPRALGGDHFYEKYRQMPMVRKGIFKYTSNGMYVVVFLGLWGIALLMGSRAALVYALFQHAYIWVHMYCTEQPDMIVLYGEGSE